MFDKIQLAAILKSNDGDFTLARIEMDRDAQVAAGVAWQQQFIEYSSIEIFRDFDPGYSPSKDELFKIENFQLPEMFNFSVDDLIMAPIEKLTARDLAGAHIKGVAAFLPSSAHNQDYPQSNILFQRITSRNIMRPNRFLWYEKGTFMKAANPMLAFGNSIAACFDYGTSRLTFRNFNTTNPYLPLEDFLVEASNPQIKCILSHHKIKAEDIERSIENATQWHRRRYALLLSNRSLDKLNINRLAEIAEHHQVPVNIEDDRLVFPAENAQSRPLLQLLNEERYRGPISKRLYETNSRVAIQSS